MNELYRIQLLASNRVVETRRTAFDKTLYPKKETETQISIYNNGKDLTEVDPMTTNSLLQLPTKVDPNEQGITGTNKISQAGFISESREEPLTEGVEMQEDASTSKRNLGIDGSNNKQIEPRYPRGDRKVSVRFTINALKRLREEEEPTMREALARPDNEKSKAAMN